MRHHRDARMHLVNLLWHLFARKYRFILDENLADRPSYRDTHRPTMRPHDEKMIL